MSEEELSDRMILIINGYKECLDYNCNQTEERQREIKYDIETLETMIDLYNKEKQKNKEYENKIKSVLELIDTKPYTAYTLYGDILYDDENIRELLEERN